MTGDGRSEAAYERAAAYFLLVAALGHSVGHYVYYVDVAGFAGERRALYEAMSGYVVDGALGTTMWGLLQMFSLSFTLLLALAGLLNLRLLRLPLAADAARAVATFNLAFWLAALALFALVHPAIQPVTIALVAVALYAGARWRRRAGIPRRAP